MHYSATSCEPWRQSAYGEDLRWRMVWQKEGLGFTHRVIANNLNVDESTVSRTLQLFHTTGHVTKRSYQRNDTNKMLTTPVQLFILELVVSRPGIYLREIQRDLNNFLMLDVSLATICKFLHRSGFTRQRLRRVAIQQDIFLREQYITDVSVYSPDMFVFIDETGADRRDTLRKYGYSLCGKPATKKSLLVRGERVSAIACMTINGILDVKTHKEVSNGDIFYDFVNTHLIQHLMPFNGVNYNSVVVLDNCSIHHCREVVESLKDIGVLVHFLPPYSPDLNPIEEMFSKIKIELKSIEQETIIEDIEAAVLASFTTITPSDCKNWISHSGVYNI